jgi:hypothetical protein
MLAAFVVLVARIVEAVLQRREPFRGQGLIGMVQIGPESGQRRVDMRCVRLVQLALVRGDGVADGRLVGAV